MYNVLTGLCVFVSQSWCQLQILFLNFADYTWQITRLAKNIRVLANMEDPIGRLSRKIQVRGLYGSHFLSYDILKQHYPRVWTNFKTIKL